MLIKIRKNNIYIPLLGKEYALYSLILFTFYKGSQPLGFAWFINILIINIIMCSFTIKCIFVKLHAKWWINSFIWCKSELLASYSTDLGKCGYCYNVPYDRY